MNKDWFTLIEKSTIPGAREKFETICGTLFKKLFPNDNVRIVEVKQGDGGIDVFVGKIGLEPIHVIQCKFFPNKFDSSQKQQIRNSFNTAIKSKEYKMYRWSLCIINTLNLDQNKWWVKWKENMNLTYNLNDDFINLIDGDSLIDSLNEQNLYDIAFERQDSLKIHAIHKSLIPEISTEELENSIIKASMFLSKVKNYFEKEPSTHIIRKETLSILNWVRANLVYPQKNLLVLEGEKGMGKSVILKDVYQQLIKEDYLVIGIKADKYYATSPKELENKLFLNDNISFVKLSKYIKASNKKLVVIIDQLDALSLTLSSNRQYIQTYNRVINEFIDDSNIKIVVSSRTFDLNYDADLSVYNSSNYFKVRASLLNEDDVKSTLSKFNVICSSKKVIELLRTPNHLETFCKLPNKQKINLNTLSSLKDLHDKLWNSLISSKQKLNLKEVLYDIADEMYKRQNITINRNSINCSQEQFNYLFSNQLLKIENSSIQFFHQTFYDYCFARQFVEKEKDIFNYLKQNEQNLEIRSIIKIVFEYLREYKHKKYIEISMKLLRSNRYRFHIKTLLISNLGIIENPTDDEKDIIIKYILSDATLEKVFMQSVFSEKWVEYLINNNIMEEYFSIEKSFANYFYDIYKKQSIYYSKFFESLNIDKISEEKRQTLWRFCTNNVNRNPFLIINHLESISNLSSKHQFTERLLLNLDNWEDKRMITFFEQYIQSNFKNNTENFWFYKVLKDMYEHHPDYVFKTIRPVFIDNFYQNNPWDRSEFSYHQKELIEAMYKREGEDSFIFMLNIYLDILNNPKNHSPYEKTITPYYKCTLFFDSFSYSEESSDYMEEFLIKHLLSQKLKRQYIMSFFNKYKNSNSIYILNIIVLFLSQTTELYIKEVFELIKIVFTKQGLNTTDDTFQLNLRKLIGSAFSLLTVQQKAELIKILLTIKNPYEQPYIYEDSNKIKKIHFPGVGRKQYAFILQLPNEDILNYHALRIRYLELNRKFGVINSNKASDVSSFSSYGVGAPIKSSAYEKMDNLSWKKSFLKFNDSYVADHGPKGGKLEHSREFRKCVINEPERYFSFINELFKDTRISNDYLSSGIDGLIDTNYNPNRVFDLIKKLINRNLDRVNTTYTIWKIAYLIEHNLVDKEIIEFLSDSALNHPHPNKSLNENYPYFDGSNSVRGSAMIKLIECCKHKEFENIIFQTVEKGILDSQISIRVSIVTNLPYLIKLNSKRSFNIFMKLVNTDDLDLLKNSFRTAKYFNSEFHFKMKSYFNKIIEYKELHKYGEIIVLSWLNEALNNKKLYKKFVKSSDEAKLCAIKVAEAYIFNKSKSVSDKSFSIINDFLKMKSEEFSSAYSGMILRKFQQQNFKIGYPFLLNYSKSYSCRSEPRYFLKFLLTSVKDYPVECLKLVQNINFEKTPNIQKSGYYNKEPVQVILAIYSKLNMDLHTNRKHIKKSLDVFDSMLKINHLSVSANNAIELTI